MREQEKSEEAVNTYDFDVCAGFLKESRVERKLDKLKREKNEFAIIHTMGLASRGQKTDLG
jgi:hypothetical protein